MKGKILRRLATLTMVITVMVITFTVSGVSAQMGQGHMGQGMMMGSCPWHGQMGPGMQGQTGPCPWWGQGQMGPGMGMGMMMGQGINIEVKKLDDGVTITYRSDDKNTAKQLQLMGEMMKLSQERMELYYREK